MEMVCSANRFCVVMFLFGNRSQTKSTYYTEKYEDYSQLTDVSVKNSLTTFHFQDLIYNSPYCNSNNSYNASSENLVLDKPIIS